jgi:signal transduction histidine kinase
MSSLLTNEKRGIGMILATLGVMLLTVFLLIYAQLQTREDLAREQGLGLARLLSGMPWEQVIDKPGKKGLLDTLGQGQSNPDFAYAQIVDNSGRVAAEVTSAGIIVPEGQLPAEPASWLGQRQLPAVNQPLQFIESHAPLFLDSDHQGFVRIGYVKPRFEFDLRQMPFLATLALPIFLLMPLFYFFLKQEMKPLKRISDSIDEFSRTHIAPSVELQPSAELSDFIQRFNQFLEGTQTRIRDLNEEYSNMEVQSKLLSYKNRKVDSILQTLPEAIMVIDESGVVNYCNPQAVNLLAIDHDSIVDHKPEDWCRNQDVTNLLAGHMIQNNAMTLSAAALNGEESDQQRELEIRTYPLFSPMHEDRLFGRLVVMQDVTERQAERRQQGEFISRVSHELKTPLNVLSMYSESLLDLELTDEEQRVEAANVIHDEVERLANLIQNLLSISQYEMGGLKVERQRVRMRDFLQDVFTNIRNSVAESGLAFELDLPQELPALHIDKALMRIAINNLLTNAIKYNKPGGSVVLKVSESLSYLDIEVSDEGYGIAEEDIPRVFDKFFRSEDEHVRQQSGHGLGLALTQQIVRIHRGEISVTSKMGEGSTFLIRLEKDFE